MASNALGYTLGGLAGLGALLDQLDRQRRADALQEMTLAKDQGTFVPVAPGEGPPQTFLERLLGGAPTPGFYDLGGGKMYRLEPYPALGESGARAVGLTTPVTESYAPMQHLPLDDTPAGPLFQTLPTPSTVTTDAVIPGAADIRLGPKERLEMLKDAARQRRDQTTAANRLERTRLWLQRTPAGVAKFQWLHDALNSDDPDTQDIANAELSRLQAPGRRADTAEDRLDQAYTIHRERLQNAVDMLDKRLDAAKERNDTRLQSALERQKSRFQERLDEIDVLEQGRNYRSELGGDVKLQIAGTPGTTTGAPTDMKTDDALAQLKQYRNKLYFPGTSAQALDTLEKVIGQLHVQERSHIGPVLTRKLQKLGEQLERAERRGNVTPTPGQSPAPAPGRQSSSTGSTATPAAQLVRTYEEMYRRIGPEEAEADLTETLTDPVKGRSPMGRAKLAAYGNVYPKLPTETTQPVASPPETGLEPAAPVAPQPPAAAAPQTRATAPPQAPQTPRPQVAPRQTPLTPQAQALLGRFVAIYDPLSNEELTREEARLQNGVAGMDVLTQYRLKAIEAVRARRQGPGGPLDESSTAPGSATPGAPGQVRSPRAQRQPQGMEEQQRLVAQYRSLTTGELNAEARRVLMSDLLTRKPETNTRLMALNALLDERKAAKPTGDYVDDATLARYRDEIKDWSTARLMEESHTLRGALASTLGAITQLKPEAWAAAGRAARWAREAAAMGGAVASFPGAAAGLPFIAPIALGLSLKSVATVFPEAGAALKDAYHRQLAIGLELHERLQPRNAPSAADEAAD